MFISGGIPTFCKLVQKSGLHNEPITVGLHTLLLARVGLLYCICHHLTVHSGVLYLN